MSLADVLVRGRAAAEALMEDVCTITAAGAGESVFNPDTLEYDDPEPDEVYDGPCRVQVTDALNEQTPDYGGREVTVQQAVVSVPISVTGIAVGQTVTITAAANDPELVGVVYRVVAIHRKSHATARRLQCQEITA